MPGQQGELVAAQAGQQITLGHALTQAGTDAAQQLVAHAVAQRIVDGLEVVQIQEQQGAFARGHAGSGPLGQTVQLFAESVAVGQPRQRIEIGQA